MMRGVLILGGVLALGVATWIAWPGADAVGRADGLMLQGRPAAAGSAEDVPPADLPLAPVARGAPIEARPFTPPEYEDPSPAGIEAPPQAGVTVEVVRKEDGTPAADAIVSWLSPSSIPGSRDLGDAGRLGDPVALLRAHARRFRAGQDGRVVVPDPGELTIVFAELGAEGGVARLAEAGEQVQRLEIVPDPPLNVLVEDGDGKPVAGVPVAVGPDGGSGIAVSTAEADAAGRVVFEHVRMLGFLDQEATFRTWLPLTLKEPVTQTFELDAMPADPVVLRIPPCGSVVVLVEEADGSPCGRKAMVALMPAGGKPRLPEVLAAKPVADGRIRFPFVQLGMELEAVARVESGGKPATTKALGPSTAGEEVQISVRFSDDEIFLAGRLLDAEGAPVCNERIGHMLSVARSGSKSYSRGRFVTDAEGRFRFAIEGADWDVGSTRRLVLVVGSVRDLGVRPRAEIDLSFDLPRGSHDLGDIRLLEPRMLVTGIVVGGRGEPIAGARVTPEWRRTYGEPGTATFGEWWEGDYEHRGETDAEGRFKLAGESEAAELRLDVHASGYIQDEPPLVSPGTHEVKVVLRRGAALLGSVIVDEGITPLHLEVSWGGGDEPGRWNSACASPAADGTFKLDGLSPGQGTFQVHTEGTPRPVLEFKQVSVLDGQENRDARLQGIDLRGKLHQIRITVVGEADRPLDGIMIFQRTGPHSSFGRGLSGDLTFDAVVGPDGGSFMLTATGCMSVNLKGVTTDQRVVMRKTPPVKIHLSGVEVPADPFGISITLTSMAERPEGEEESMPLHQSQAAELGRDGLAEFDSVAPGRYEVTMTWFRRSGNKWTGTSIEMSERQFITVIDTGVEQTFQAGVSREALKRAQGTLR